MTPDAPALPTTVVAAGAPEVPGRLGPDDQPVFCFDCGSAESYLAAERVLGALPVTAEWLPVALGSADAMAAEEVERLAAERGLLPVRWPPATDSELAQQVATFAKQGGKTVQFAQACLRQVFAAGRVPADETTVLLAAAACEMHPKAVLTGARTKGTARRLAAQTAWARAHGVQRVPALVVGDRVFHGDAGVDAAAAALGG